MLNPKPLWGILHPLDWRLFTAPWSMINTLTLYTQRSGVWDEGKCPGWLASQSCEMWAEVSAVVPWSHCVVHPHPMGVDRIGFWICNSLVQGSSWACLHYLGQFPRVYQHLLLLQGFSSSLSSQLFWGCVVRLYPTVMGDSQLGHGRATAF